MTATDPNAPNPNPRSNPGKGERDNVSTHRVDYKARASLPIGVNWNQSSLYDLSINPWNLGPNFIRQVIVAYAVLQNTTLQTEPGLVRVLDVGCGFGELGTLLTTARKAGGARLEYVGFDLDGDKIAIGKELRPKLELLQYDIFDLMRKEPYDACICSEVYEHLPKDRSQQVLRMLASQLKPGGLLVMTIPTPTFADRVDYSHHLNEEAASETIPKLRLAGFTMVDNYHLRIASPKRSVPNIHHRLPGWLAGVTLSAVQDDGTEGAIAVHIARKEYWDGH